MYQDYEIKQTDSLYPDSLLDLERPPEKLYVRGNVELLSDQGLGVVGARKATPYGLSCAAFAGRIAALCEVTTISGGAVGCDARALQSALDNGGKAVIVAGCGADVIYPASSEMLFERAWEGEGVVVSLEPWGAKPKRYTFPKRNPIIAALSKALLIVEAANPSGTFSTALAADKLGRQVYAVPGSIFSPLSAGTNRLISEGASMICDAASLEMQLSLDFGQLCMQKDLNPIEDTIVSVLLASSCTVDSLASYLSIPAREVMSILGDYELSGLVQRLPDGRFSLTEHGYLSNN